VPRRPTGQEPGQPGVSWGDLLDQLVAEHGSLAGVAWKLLEHGQGPEDVASVERGLRRLRARGQHDGGTWGQRLLRVYGLPRPLEERVAWMGLYHSPFNDLPLPLCLDQLRVWDRPPVASSRARLWLHLGFASCALRARDAETAAHQLARARATASPFQTAAQLEIALASAYLASRGGDPGPHLAEAEGFLGESGLAAADAACFRARLVDQRAFALNRRREHAAAFALYQGLPAADVHPFASYRRDAGLAYGHLQRGELELALACARRACQHAGDGGYVRLRVMGLLMEVKILGPADGAGALARARAIATRLGDEELLARVARAEP
jgi:hypothetical protein